MWPRPDWASQINDERPDEVIEILTRAYDSIRKNPRTKEPPISNSQWEDSYATSISILKALFRKTKTIEQALQINQRFCERFGLDYNNIHALPIEKTYIYWTISALPVDSIEKNAMFIGESPEAIIENTTSQDEPTISVETPKVEPVVIPPEVNQIAVEQSKDDKKRFGPSFLDKKLDPNEFRNDFGLKFLVINKECKTQDKLLQECYESLCDLADALEIPRKWIGMQKMILRVGHDDLPEKDDLNESITYSGEGIHNSIAYQWMKYFDARVASTIKTNMPTVDKYMSTMYQESLSGTHTDKTKAIYRIVRKMTLRMSRFSVNKYHYFNESLVFERESQLPNGSFTAIPEMLARAFDAFVEDKLQTLSRANPHLTSDTIKGSQKVYPKDAERKELNILFLALFRALKQSEAAPQNLTNNNNQ